MDIRTLKYFLAVAREENITRAAESLHVSQPTLSKQIKQLESELGKRLFTRGSGSVRLTDEGELLRRRAADIVDMTDRTVEEFASMEDEFSGDVRIGCGESRGFGLVADAMKAMRDAHPRVRFHIYSGNTEDISGRLDRGVFDFAVVCHGPDLTRYESLSVPFRDTWGVVMRADHPLAALPRITPDDLRDQPLVLSRQSMTEDYPKWFVGETIQRDAGKPTKRDAGKPTQWGAGKPTQWGGRTSDDPNHPLPESLNIAATFNLAYNAGVLVREGVGIALCFDMLIDTGPDSGLCFRPLFPQLETEMNVIWRRYQVFSPAAEMFLGIMRDRFGMRN